MYDGAEWYGAWGGSVTDLAEEGAAGFFDGLVRLV